MTLIYGLIASLAINTVLFLVAYKLQSDKLTDISYAISFITLAMFYFVHAGGGIYNAVGFVLVTMWAARLGGFLLMRVMHVGKDQRFDGTRENFGKFAKFWIGQGFVAWLLMLPFGLGLSRIHNWTWWALIGVAVWAVGFAVEATADAQKYSFRLDIQNKGKWIESGLWRYARHPNYFGEIAVWIGVYAYAFPAMTNWQRVVGLVSPIGIAYVLIRISGVPPLELKAEKTWGKDPAYKAYKKRSRVLVPLP